MAAQLGLTGLEFGVNIPGTVGGAVKMNANAYGGDLSRVLEWVEIASPGEVTRRSPDQLGFSYRRSHPRPRGALARPALPPRPPRTAGRSLAPAGGAASRRRGPPPGGGE